MILPYISINLICSQGLNLLMWTDSVFTFHITVSPFWVFYIDSYLCWARVCHQIIFQEGLMGIKFFESLHLWKCLFDLIPVQFSSVQSLSCVQLFATPWTAAHQASVHHQLPESTQTHIHWVGSAIQPSHPLSSASPPALNLSQHQGLFKWVSSLNQVAKLLEFQLQYQSFQWTPRTDLL